MDLQCHAHNDYGLAVANTLAALQAGARYFHVTVNGIGERAGMPDIAQVAMLLKKLCHVELGLLFPKFIPLSRIVARHSRTALYPWHPIVGRNIFSHESGIHSNGSIRCRDTFGPCPQSFSRAQGRLLLVSIPERMPLNTC